MKKETGAPEGENLDGVAAEKATKLETSELLTGEPNEKLLIIRHDDPAKVYERQKVSITGILDTPARYLKKRVAIVAGGAGALNLLASHLIVNRQKMTLALTIHEEDFFKHHVKGSLELHPDFIAFRINNGDGWEAFALGDFVRMNRTKFETVDIANKLVAQLKSFKAKVNTEKEKTQNQNGDFKTLLDQVVTHNLPKSLWLTMPIFKGYPAESFEVEVHVRPQDLAMVLLSPEAKDKQDVLVNKAIDEQLLNIEETAPTLLIVEE